MTEIVILITCGIVVAFVAYNFFKSKSGGVILRRMDYQKTYQKLQKNFIKRNGLVGLIFLVQVEEGPQARSPNPAAVIKIS